MQIILNKNPEFYSLFCLFGLNNLPPLTGMTYFVLKVFRVRAKSYVIRLVNGKLVVKDVF